MISKLKVQKNTLLSDVLLFDEMELGKINLLGGPNGSGKSTLISHLINYWTHTKKSDLDLEFDKEMDVYTYINSKQNRRYMDKNPDISYADLCRPNIQLLKLASQSMSEGQSIVYSMFDILNSLAEIPFSDNRDILIVFDEMDSGLSLDNIDYIMNKVYEISEVRDDMQFIIAFNNYAVCRKYHKVKSMIDGKTINIQSYEEFFKFISSNHNTILEKRNYNMFTGEILGG